MKGRALGINQNWPERVAGAPAISAQEQRSAGRAPDRYRANVGRAARTLAFAAR